MIASSSKPTASEFARVLLEAVPISYLDIYAQDSENGWNALHRALYAGNIGVARMLLHRDAQESLDFKRKGKGKMRDNGAGAAGGGGGLLWVKDREGNTPFDLFAQTIRKRDIAGSGSSSTGEGSINRRDLQDYEEEEDEDDFDDVDMDNTHVAKTKTVNPSTNLSADQVFTFGSNKNFSLGLGDHDDRTFPEQVSLTRPDHLLHRFYKDHQIMRLTQRGIDPATVDIPDVESIADIPTIIRTQPIIVQDVIMSKLSTAILTSDPESNLYMAGFGPGGRLGTGDEGTRFTFSCITGGGLASKRIIAVALGQDHSIAVTDHGDIFSWGTNKFGQLGYTLPASTDDAVVPMQLYPRQIFNPFKREVVLGAAASSIHSAVFTTSGLYTFGKNEGQLGFMDADARSLKCQIIPRKVGAALFSAPIKQVCAIERATTVLLENRDVWCFTHYGYSKIVFPLDSPASSLIRDSFLSTRYGKEANKIVKITAGGNTIVGLSSFGEVYAVELPYSKHDGASSSSAALQSFSGTASVSTSGSGAGGGGNSGVFPPSGTASPSTTNPTKCRNAIPPPTRVWSLKKSFMAARDVAVGRDGSIILSTESGSAWRREKRVKKKSSADAAIDREFKFVRVFGLARVVAVRSNAFGAYAAVTRGSDVARTGIEMPEKTIWDDLRWLIPLGIGDVVHNLHEKAVDLMRVWPGEAGYNIEADEAQLVAKCEQCFAGLEGERGLVWLGVDGHDVKFPIHQFLLMARSPVLSELLIKLKTTKNEMIPGLLHIDLCENGRINITFDKGIDFLAVFDIWIYAYTDKTYDIWLRLRLRNLSFGSRQFDIRLNVMKIAAALDLCALERSARLQDMPVKRLHLDMERAFSSNPHIFDDADVALELEGGVLVYAHSSLLVQRSLFFKNMFHGMSAGRWLSARHSDRNGTTRIDLRHIDPFVFKFVLRFIYVDTDDELFDDVKCDTLDELIDIIISVMAVANELMIDRLAQVCQKILGRYVTTRNVCPLLNTVAPCFVRAFKNASLEYICINLETMLEGNYLNDLDVDLISDLDNVCHENQLACEPVARGRDSEEFWFERYPELVPLIEENKQRRVDAMRLKSRLHEDEEKFRRNRVEKVDSSVSTSASKTDDVSTPTRPPALRSKVSAGDMMFEMEEESFTPVTETDASLSRQPSISTPVLKQQPWNSETPSRPRTDLSAIMAEASASTTPQSVRSTQALPATPSSATSARLSQKERKKLKQQQMREMMMEEEEKNLFRSSPWQRQQQVASTSASAKKQQSPAQASPSLSTMASSPSSFKSPQPGAARASSSKPGMTLRQTVAGGVGAQENSFSKGDQQQLALHPPSASRVAPLQAQQQRGPVVNPNSPFAKQTPQHAPTLPRPGPSALSNSLNSPRGAPPSPATPSSQTPQPIRSIRYNTSPPDPTPAELALRQNSLTSSTPTRSSLAAILLEQQTEKDVIREAATARHNLEEIQLEQQFQEWWDQESKRVQQQAESEAARNAKKQSKGKSGKGRHGDSSHVGGKGKVKEQKAGEGSQQVKATVSGPAGQKKKRGNKDTSSNQPPAANNPDKQSKPPQGPSRHSENRRGHHGHGKGGGSGGGHGPRDNTNKKGKSQGSQGQVST